LDILQIIFLLIDPGLPVLYQRSVKGKSSLMPLFPAVDKNPEDPYLPLPAFSVGIFQDFKIRECLEETRE
jgi:hypothetical protein